MNRYNDFKQELLQINNDLAGLIKKGASIGSNATLMCGITIGERAVVGAGSVVTRDVPADTVAAEAARLRFVRVVPPVRPKPSNVT